MEAQVCDEIGSSPVGGGNLSARHVIHAVGPRKGEGIDSISLQHRPWFIELKK